MRKYMAAPRKDDPLIQSAVRLPQSLMDRLKAQGPLGAELRRHAERSLELEAAGPYTEAFIMMLVDVAVELKDRYGSWHNDKFAHQALRLAVQQLLGPGPPGPAVPHPSPLQRAELERASGLLDPGPPRTVTPEEVADRLVFLAQNRDRRR